MGYRNPAHSRPKVVLGLALGMEADWIGFRVRLCLEWRMKIVGYERAEFSQICKRNFKGSISEL